MLAVTVSDPNMIVAQLCTMSIMAIGSSIQDGLHMTVVVN